MSSSPNCPEKILVGSIVHWKEGCLPVWQCWLQLKSRAFAHTFEKSFQNHRRWRSLWCQAWDKDLLGRTLCLAPRDSRPYVRVMPQRPLRWVFWSCPALQYSTSANRQLLPQSHRRNTWRRNARHLLALGEFWVALHSELHAPHPSQCRPRRRPMGGICKAATPTGNWDCCRPLNYFSALELQGWPRFDQDIFERLYVFQVRCLKAMPSLISKMPSKQRNKPWESTITVCQLTLLLLFSTLTYLSLLGWSVSWNGDNRWCICGNTKSLIIVGQPRSCPVTFVLYSFEQLEIGSNRTVNF